MSNKSNSNKFSFSLSQINIHHVELKKLIKRLTVYFEWLLASTMIPKHLQLSNTCTLTIIFVSWIDADNDWIGQLAKFERNQYFKLTCLVWGNRCITVKISVQGHYLTHIYCITHGKPLEKKIKHFTVNYFLGILIYNGVLL